MNIAAVIRRRRRGGGSAGISSIAMTGLTSGTAIIGDHASISVGFPDGVTEWTSQTWGTDYGDDTYGTGANPTDYTAGDDGPLRWEGIGDDGNTYRATAPIRYAAPVEDAAPVASGDPVIGESLSGTAGTFTGGGLTDDGDEWEVSDDGSTGWTGTGDTDLTGPAMVAGKHYRLATTASNSGGSLTTHSNVIGPAVAPVLTLEGLTSGSAIIGDHASISVSVDQGTITARRHGSTSGGSEYGTSTNPTDFEAGDEGTLYSGVQVGGVWYESSALIRYAFGTAPAIDDGQEWVVDDTAISIDASATGANLDFTYAISGVPDDVTINPDTGQITGTLDFAISGASDSGTATVTATDKYGTEYQDTFTWSYALRDQATGGVDLDLSFPAELEIEPVDLAQNWTMGGNSGTFSVVETLPAGLSVNNVGVLFGTPEGAVADATYTLRHVDDYGRITDDTFTLETTEASTEDPPVAAGGIADQDYVEGVAISALDVGADFTGDNLTFALAPTSADLPTGLSMDASAVITGTPTTAAEQVNITVRATNSGGSADTTFAVTISEVVIAATIDPVMPEFIFEGQTLAANVPNWTDFLDTDNYSSNAGTISSVTPTFLLDAVDASTPFVLDDVISVRFTVIDSEDNEKDFTITGTAEYIYEVTVTENVATMDINPNYPDASNVAVVVSGSDYDGTYTLTKAQWEGGLNILAIPYLTYTGAEENLEPPDVISRFMGLYASSDGAVTLPDSRMRRDTVDVSDSAVVTDGDGWTLVSADQGTALDLEVDYDDGVTSGSVDSTDIAVPESASALELSSTALVNNASSATVAIGAADDDRVVFVSLLAGDITANSLTVNASSSGVTRVAEANSAYPSRVLEVWQKTGLTTGTTADVAITGSGQVYMGVFRTIGYEFDSFDFDRQAGSNTTGVTLTVTVPIGGAVLLHGKKYNSVTGPSGIVTDESVGPITAVRAYWINTTGSVQTNLDFNFAIASSAGEKYAIAVVVRPIP